jgi:hypothetical protein
VPESRVDVEDCAKRRKSRHAPITRSLPTFQVFGRSRSVP